MAEDLEAFLHDVLVILKQCFRITRTSWRNVSSFLMAVSKGLTICSRLFFMTTSRLIVAHYIVLWVYGKQHIIRICIINASNQLEYVSIPVTQCFELLQRKVLFKYLLLLLFVQVTCKNNYILCCRNVYWNCSHSLWVTHEVYRP